MRGFTKTGQPIMGRRYLIAQDGLLPETEAIVVAKFFGKGGNADLIGIMLEEPNGGRTDFPWPLEEAIGSAPITFVAAPRKP